jgi:hypothetical protein
LEYIREGGEFKNQTFDSLCDVETNLCSTAIKLMDNKEKVKSLTGFSWVKNVFWVI